MQTTFSHSTAFAVLLVAAGITHVACAESTDQAARPANQIMGVWCVENTEQTIGAVTFDFRKNGLLIARCRDNGRSLTECGRVQTARWSISGKLIKLWGHSDKRFGGRDWTAEITIDGNTFTGSLRGAENSAGSSLTGKRSFSQFLR